MFELAGRKVEDKISGFTGIATARVEFMNGCVQIQIMPKMKKGEIEYPGGIYFDIEQIKVLPGKPLKINPREDIEGEPSGGFRKMPPSRQQP